jgi:serine/threonine-protein kinase SBK
MIFDADFHKVKLIDFGMTRKCGSYVRRLIGSIPYSPPEVCDAINNDILVSTAMDVWALGVLLFCSLTGIKRKIIREKKKSILFRKFSLGTCTRI